MGTLSKSIKKIESIESDLSNLKRHLNNLRVKLKKPEYFIGVDYAEDDITTCNGFVDSNRNYHWVTTIEYEPLRQKKPLLIKKNDDLELVARGTRFDNLIIDKREFKNKDELSDYIKNLTENVLVRFEQ